MALQKQLVNLTTDSGIDTKTDPNNLTAPKLSELVNLRFRKTGALSPRKQFTTKSTLSGVYNNSNYVVGLRDVIYAESDDRIYQIAGSTKTSMVSSWSPDGQLINMGANTGISGGVCSQTTSSVMPDDSVFSTWRIETSPNNKFGYQFLLANGDRLTGNTQTLSGTSNFVTSTAGPNSTGYIWVLSGSGGLTGYAATGNTLTALTVPSLSSVNAFSIRWSAVDNAFIVAYDAAGSTVVNKWTVSGTTVTAGTATVVYAGVLRTVDIVRTTNYIAVLYWKTAGAGGGVLCDYFTSSLVLSTSRAIVSDTGTYDMIGGFGGCETATANQIVLNYSPTSLTTGATLSTYQIPYSGSITTIRAAKTVGFIHTSRPIFYNRAVFASAVDLIIRGAQTYSLVQIADLSGNGISNPIESVCFWASGSAAANAQLPIIGNDARAYKGNIANSSVAVCVPCEYLATVEQTDYTGLLAPSYSSDITAFFVNGNQVAGVMRLDKSNFATTRGYSHGTSSFIAGANLRGVDGSGVAPGCLWPNFSPLNMALTAASSPLSTDTYVYVFRKVWSDTAGNTQSQEGLPIRVTGRVISSVNYFRASFHLPAGAFDLPNKSTGGDQTANIEIYRSEANGSIPYYSNTITVSSAGTYTDTVSTLNLSRPLPSASGELLSTPPPLIRASATWKGRIALLIADNDTKIWYSKPNEDFTFPAFASGLEIAIPQATERLTALATMDGVLYAFNTNQVFTIYGDPAGATGEGGSVTIPEIRFNGVGCSDPQSVILTPKGLFFKSDKGFYLILRNQELVFVGEGPFNNNPTITGSWCDESTSEVGFSSLTDLWTYDWEAKAWARTETALTTGYDITNAALIQGQPTIINRQGIYQMTESDVSETYPVSVTTAWIRLGGLQDYQRVFNTYLLMKYERAHTLTVNLYIDYNDTQIYSWSIPSGSLGSTNPEQIRLSMPVQKCEAFKLSISSATAGWSLTGIMAEIGTKNHRYNQRQAANTF